MSAWTTHSSSPPLARMTPQGSATMLWPANCRPRFAPPQLLEARKTWFSIERAQFRICHASTRGYGQPDAT
jgi:hypothetical protein